MAENANLKYLFTCRLKDGTIITQNPEDVSPTNPEKSAFYDVAQRLDEVEVFSLVLVSPGKPIEPGIDYVMFHVDLHDGTFVSSDRGNYTMFTAQDPSAPVLPAETKYRLVYFRRVRLHFNGHLEQVGKEIEYHIGWQTTDAEGKNRQQTIALW